MDADGSSEQNITNHVPIASGDNSVDWQPLLAPANEPPASVLGLDSAIYIATYPSPPTLQLTVTRSGNLNESVSCDYAVSGPNDFGTPPRGTFTFASGETSKTIAFSYYYSRDRIGTFDIGIYNNWGNATFVGGVKHAPILFVGQGDNPIDNSAYFVRQQYRDFLSRESTPRRRSSFRLNFSRLVIWFTESTKQLTVICRARQCRSDSANFCRILSR